MTPLGLHKSILEMWSAQSIFSLSILDIATGRYKLKIGRSPSIPKLDRDSWVSTAPEYEWQPLQNISDIRLVHLYPAPSYEDTLIICILTYSKDNLPEYTALSYHWGDPKRVNDVAVLSSKGPTNRHITETKSETSLVDEATESNFEGYKRITIQQNLLLALRRIRRQHKIVLVWTDFLCINQDDIPEKNVQVLRMRDVYLYAASTTVFLGEASSNDHSDKMHVILPQITDWVENGYLESNLNKERYIMDISKAVYEGLGDVRLFPEAITTDDQWREFQITLRAFFSRPWFRRVWVIQEVEPAMKRNNMSSLHVLCGDQDLDWFELTWAWIVSEHMPLTNAEKSKAGHAPVFQLVEKSRKPLSLFELLCHSQELEASDARDHCYALLGMSGLVEVPALKPDYHSNARDAFMRYTRFLVEQGFGQRLLLRSIKAHYMKTDAKPCPDLPSWAPDWSIPTLYEMPFSPEPHQVYAAGGQSNGHFHICDGNILVTRGFFLDTMPVARYLKSYYTPDLDRFAEPIRSNLSRVEWACKFLMHYMSQHWNGAWFNGNIAEYLVRFLLIDLIASRSERLQRIPPAVHDMIAALVNRDFDRLERYVDSHEVQLYLSAMYSNLRRCSLAVSWKGYLARVPQEIEQTDVIAIILGCDVPLILSEVSDQEFSDQSADLKSSKMYRIKGWAFIPGVMDGEALQSSETSIEDILLV